MLKKFTIRKFSYALILLFLTFLFVIFPKKEETITPKGKSVEYISDNTTHGIYMVSKDNYVARVDVLLNEEDIKNKIRDIVEYLIIDGKKESNIPNGFRSIIPSGTEIKNIELKDGIIKINFSKEILEIDESLEEKMIESIVYSLTSIEGVKGVLIYVEGDLLTSLPKTKMRLPSVLTRDFGINKEYDITNTKDINKTTIYYIGKNSDKYYYVPVTKINNNSKDKVKVIIDELSSGPTYEDNLMSFLNINTKLLDYNIKDNKMYLVFNDYILDNIEKKSILEEVVYSISLSVNDNYKNIEEVVFMLNDEEITKNVIKTLE